MHQWVECIEAVSGSVGSANGAIAAALDHFSVLLAQHSANITHATGVVESLSRRISGSSGILIDCLADLAAMSRAMEDVIDANPEEAHGLVFNIFGIFLRQLRVFFKDAFESLDQTELAFRNWARYSGSASPTMSSSSVVVVAEEAPEMVIASADPQKPDASVKKKKKKTGEGKKKQVRDVSGDSDCPLVVDEPRALSNSRQKGQLQEAEVEPDAEESFNFGAVATTDAVVATQQDPDYLQVTSTVEDALGRLVLSSRPNVFTSPELMEQRAPIIKYYIRLPTPGRLGPFLLKNYIELEEDMQVDLMCDILLTDCVDVDPFVSPAGAIVVMSLASLRGVPACGWRLGVSENCHDKLYTQYILVDGGAFLHPSLLIQDSIVKDGEREEVLHVITPFPEAPQFATVTAHGFSTAAAVRNFLPTRKHSNSRISAIVNITKNVYERNGFVEVRESDIRAAAEQMQERQQQQLPQDMEFLARRSTAAAFHGTVELASLEQPGEPQGWGISDVAKGAVRGAAAVVLAPVSVGMVVGNAVLNASGVVGAIKQQTDTLFRKSFPHLESEEIIETFNCAFLEKNNTIPRPGFLFVTPHWLCFQASLVSSKFSLEWNEIKDIQKQRSVKVLENAITVLTHVGDVFFLTSFVQREQAYSAVMSQWLRK